MIWHTQDFTEKCEEECMVSISRFVHVPWLNTETSLPLKFFSGFVCKTFSFIQHKCGQIRHKKFYAKTYISLYGKLHKCEFGFNVEIFRRSDTIWPMLYSVYINFVISCSFIWIIVVNMLIGKAFIG